MAHCRFPFNECGGECSRVRIAVEENVVAHIQPYRGNFTYCAHLIIVIEYSLHYPWQNLYSSLPIFEVDHRHHMPALPCVVRLLFLLLCYLVGNGQTPAVSLVDGVHHLPKQLAVGRGVLQVVDTYVIMYHLVDYRIFYLPFSQVEAGAYSHAEVIELHLPENCQTLFERTLSEEGLGIA